MTCDELQERLDAWAAGALSGMKAREMEQHAAECVSCYARLDSASRLGTIARRLTVPPALRAASLAAVSRRRALRRWRQVAVGGVGIAAVALIALMSRPRVKSASDFPGAAMDLLAMEHARPDFAVLDAAESEISDALAASPDDPRLTAALDFIHAQREALSRLVREVGS